MKIESASTSSVANPPVGLYLKSSLAERDSAEKPKPGSSKPIPLRLTPTPEVRAEQSVRILPDTERKPARVQIKGPHDSSSAVQYTALLSGTRDQGVDPITIYLDSSTEVDPSSTKATMGSPN